MARDRISVVIPVYNEEPVIGKLMERLLPVMEGMDREYEIILVDDGSTDRSLEIMKGYAGGTVLVVELTRNFGQHAAVFAGFENSKGEIVITLDADLQNPPEEIPRLVEHMETGGFEVVGTVRATRNDPAFRKLASRLVNALTRRITGVSLNDWGCMLRAYRRSVVQHMVNSKEHSTFIPALAVSFAKGIAEIEVKHEQRYAGESKYPFRKLVSLHFDLVTSFSDLPLKILLYSGFIMSLLGIGFGLLLLVARFMFGAEWAAQGVFTLFAILFFFLGAQFFALGLMGEYIGRIYREVKNRPAYTIRRIY